MAKVLSVEQKAKMAAGRRAVRGCGVDECGAVGAKLLLMPERFRRSYRMAMGGRNRAAGVRSFCCECMGWEDVVVGIRGCTSALCPLYPYRPYR